MLVQHMKCIILADVGWVLCRVLRVKHTAKNTFCAHSRVLAHGKEVGLGNHYLKFAIWQYFHTLPSALHMGTRHRQALPVLLLEAHGKTFILHILLFFLHIYCTEDPYISLFSPLYHRSLCKFLRDFGASRGIPP
jgi:hypothetical protein